MSNVSTLVKLKKAIASSALVAILASMFVVSTASASDLSWVSAEAASLVNDRNTLSEPVNKCVFGQMLQRAAQFELVSGDHGFADVPAWCDDIAFTLKQMGIYNGRTSTELGMSDASKAELLVALTRALDYPQADLDACVIPSAHEAAILGLGWDEQSTKQLCKAYTAGIATQSQDLTGSTNKGVAATMLCNSYTCVANPVDPTDPTTPVDPTVPVGGDLMVELSDNSPSSAEIPGSAENLPVAVYSFTTGNQDVLLTSLEFTRGGLNADGSLDSVALIDESGFRLSNDKSFTSSEDIANVNLTGGGMLLPKNSTTDITVMGVIGDAATFGGQTFFVSLVDATAVGTTANVSGPFPVSSNAMKIGNVDAATLLINAGSSTPDVSVGQQMVEVYEGRLENNSGDNTDIAFMGITLEHTGTAKEDTELGNFELYVDGDMVAMTPMAREGFIAFNLDTPFVLEDGDEVDFNVHADILGGAGETIDFQVDSDLDVRAMDLSFGFGAGIDATGFNADGNTTTIDGGEVTVVAEDPAYDEVAADKDNVILGTLHVTVNSGKDLELKQLGFNFDNTVGTGAIADIFENIEVVTPYGTYDLDSTGDEGDLANGPTDDFNVAYFNDNVDIQLPDGTTTDLVLRADTLAAADMDTLNMEISVTEIGAATQTNSLFYVEELGDDTAITDITPSSLTFDTIEGVADEAVVKALTQSDKTAVVGTKNVLAMLFEVEAGSAGYIDIEEVDLTSTVVDALPADSAVLDNTRVSQLKLYVDSFDPAAPSTNLLKTQSGSKLSGGDVTFEFKTNKVRVEASQKRKFYIVLDLTDDDTQAGDDITVSVDDITVRDSDNDTIDATDKDGNDLDANDVDSDRTITLAEKGTLEILVDNTDPKVDQDKNVLAGGAMSDYVASFEFTATNEDILVQDILIENEVGADALADAVSEVVIFDENEVEIARESLTSGDDSVLFEDIDFTVEEGSENIYVKVVANRIGKDEAGIHSDDYNLALSVRKAKGSSELAVTDLDYDAEDTDALADNTAVSNVFAVVPVLITDLEFVSSYGGESVSTNNRLNPGQSTLAIVKFTNASHTNTDSTSGAALETLLQEVVFDIDKSAALTLAVGETTIERIGGADGEIAATVSAAYGGGDEDLAADSAGFLTFDLEGGMTSDHLLESGEVAYYVIKTSVTLDATSDFDDFLRISLENLNSGIANTPLTYKSDDLLDVIQITEPRLDDSRLTGPQLNENA